MKRWREIVDDMLFQSKQHFIKWLNEPDALEPETRFPFE